jgi:pilus assembly protein CpaB
VLRDVRVVGVDQTLSEDTKTADKKADKKDLSPPRTATLEVTPKQAEIVAVAVDLGVLSLSLRSLGHADGDEAADPPTHTWDIEAVQGILEGSPSDHPRRPTSAQPFSRVVVVRGDTVTEVMMSPRALKAAVTP